MVWLPNLQLVWAGGWALMLFASAVQWGMLLSMPREVFTRLFDRRDWDKKRMLLFRLGKLLALVCIILVFFSPIQTDSAFFIPGEVLYGLGLAGLVKSLMDYCNSPMDQPATSGLYRFSRHPQVIATVVVFLGICLSDGHITASHHAPAAGQGDGIQRDTGGGASLPELLWRDLPRLYETCTTLLLVFLKGGRHVSSKEEGCTRARGKPALS